MIFTPIRTCQRQRLKKLQEDKESCIIFNLHQILVDDNVDRTCSKREKVINTYKILIGESEENSLLEYLGVVDIITLKRFEYMG
jgi:hypothetical protein